MSQNSCNWPMDSSAKAPGWMRHLLYAAAAYNIIFGLFAGFFPLAAFSLFSLPAPAYPSLWQCIGMIVGVYGIGYAIAATDPYKHWPIILVGLLGKVLGPFGFVMTASQGDLPWSWGTIIVFNDLIWWIPFGMILWSAAKANQPGNNIPEHVEHFFPMGEIRSNFGVTVDELSQDNPVLLVFLRHAGCTFCREAMADIARVRDEIKSMGVMIGIVHMDRDEDVADQFFKEYGLDDVHRFSDPYRQLYNQFDLPTGSMNQLFGWKVWFRGFKAGVLDGHGVGELRGNGFQMPGLFLIYRCEMIAAHLYKSAADRPNYVGFVQEELKDHPVFKARSNGHAATLST